MKKLLLLVLISCLLSACVTVESNASALPTLTKNKATICLSQPYHYVDVYLVLGTTSEGINYGFSRTYVTDHQTHQRYYLGNLHRSTVCFYANSGSYTLEIDSPGQTPSLISESLEFTAGNYYFYSLQSNDTKHKLRFKQISAEKGLEYFKKIPVKSFQPLEKFPIPFKKRIHIHYQIINHISRPLLISRYRKDDNAQQDNSPAIVSIFSNALSKDDDQPKIHVNPGKFAAYTDIQTTTIEHASAQAEFLIADSDVKRTPAILSIESYVSGLDNIDKKSVLVTVNTRETPSLHYIWASHLRSQTNCHSSFLSADVNINCNIFIYEIKDASSRNAYTTNKTDDVTRVEEARDDLSSG